MFSNIREKAADSLPVGPRSVLWGAHCFFIHPWFVARAWTRLYGFPTDPRLWVAFFVHDLGYFVYWCRNMDGPEGERHVEWGAQLMLRCFGAEWGDFCRYHSRFSAKRDGQHFSRLCVADKMSVTLEPWWLYLPRVMLSGEIKEYMALAQVKEGSKYHANPLMPYNVSTTSRRAWFHDMTTYLAAWVEEHKGGRSDSWTVAPQADDH